MKTRLTMINSDDDSEFGVEVSKTKDGVVTLKVFEETPEEYETDFVLHDEEAAILANALLGAIKTVID